MGQAETRRLQQGRPLSPHLQVWRWHVTMLTSILHRASGGALYAGAAGLAAWLLLGAFAPAVFESVDLILRSIPGQVVLFLLLLALVYHFVNGLRHLTWDAGAGLNVRAANASGWLALIVSILAAAAIFAAALLV
jgi:succinate dehydrogenase / fumarate reductase cytochrome b subunit